MTAKVLLDANILIELFQKRQRTRQVQETIKEHEFYLLCISILSVDLLLYFVERDKGSKRVAHDFLKNYQILDMNKTDYEWAQANDRGDFEDALQVACALRHGCQKLITLDQRLAKNHEKHIITKLVR